MDLYLKEGQSLALPTRSDRSLRLGMGRVRELVSSATYPRVLTVLLFSAYSAKLELYNFNTSVLSRMNLTDRQQRVKDNSGGEEE